MTSKSRSNESLCEKSMQVVINIMKLSSFSLVKMSPQTPGASLSSKSIRPTSTKAAKSPPPARRSRGSLKSQKLQKPVSYLLEPVAGNKSMIVICDEEKSVDEMAADYITNVYEKIKFESSEKPNFSAHMQSSFLL